MSQSLGRTPPIKPSDITTEQKEAHDFLLTAAKASFPPSFGFKWQDEHGALLGPFPTYLAIPACAKPIIGALMIIGQVPGVSATVRETVILATASHYKTLYETYAHERIALNGTDLTKDQIRTIRIGQKPEDLDVGPSIAYDAAKELLTKPGPLRKGTWDALVEEFGKQGALTVVHFVGQYAYGSILMNAVDTPLPEGEQLFE